eukprot:TRINITY_DN2996_c0_g1_i1.p1 TRINITY_DN2996_c0_g1~~TRINITY_DN2996_c0_g1_i1.p1  ORF type:complete len:347 (-),score=34.60 TRINITY_DN2996_c0_g1_i1:349-1389(-)
MTLEEELKVERAAQILEKALILKPDNIQLLGKYAKILKALNRCEEAAQVYSRLSQIEQSNNDHALYSQAQCLRFAGNLEQAATIYRQYLEQHPKDERAQFWYAAVQGKDGTKMSKCPRIVVSQLFDAYADTFDQHLTLRLQYQTPQIIQKILENYMHLKSLSTWNTCVDLGCGTGLMAPILRPMVKKLSGVDLSQGMISKARVRDSYDFLAVDDAVNFLQQCHQQVELLQHHSSIDAKSESLIKQFLFDLIVAADVIVYIGDLYPILKASRSVCRNGSVFIFSTELLTTSIESYLLQSSGRYAHSEDYINQMSTQNGWKVVSIENCTIRNNKDVPVLGQVVLLEAI